MSTFLYMKLLESTPARHDREIRMLSGDKIGRVYERVAELVAARGKRVRDIGCGTGAVLRIRRGVGPPGRSAPKEPSSNVVVEGRVLAILRCKLYPALVR